MEKTQQGSSTFPVDFRLIPLALGLLHERQAETIFTCCEDHLEVEQFARTPPIR